MKIKQLENYQRNLKRKIREMETYITEGMYVLHHTICTHQKQEADSNEKNIEEYYCNKVYEAEDLIGYTMDMIKELENVEKILTVAKEEVGIFGFEGKRASMESLLRVLNDMSKATRKTADEMQTSYRLDEEGNPVRYQYNRHVEADIDYDHVWAAELYAKVKAEYEEEEEKILRKKIRYEVDYTPKYQLDFPLCDNMKIYLESR